MPPGSHQCEPCAAALQQGKHGSGLERQRIMAMLAALTAAGVFDSVLHAGEEDPVAYPIDTRYSTHNPPRKNLGVGRVLNGPDNVVLLM